MEVEQTALPGIVAAAYVLILAAFGPLAARMVQPFITAIAKRA